jgi:hypothetical protein
MAGKPDIAHEVEDHVLQYIRETPKAVLVLFASLMSGHLWVYVITVMRGANTRGNKQLQSYLGHTSVGLGWFSVVLVVLYCCKFRRLDFDYANILELAIPTVLTGLFIQFVVIAVFVRFGGRK